MKCNRTYPLAVDHSRKRHRPPGKQPFGASDPELGSVVDLWQRSETDPAMTFHQAVSWVESLGHKGTG